MDLISPFSALNSLLVARWLSEDSFTPQFSVKQRAYYRLIRPLLPPSIRQMVQRRHWRKSRYFQDFIDAEMVEWVKSHEWGRRTLQCLYPEPYRFVITLTHDVETAEGLARVPKIIEIESARGFRSSWNIVPYKYPIDEGILRDIRLAGHEIGVHGFNHDGRLFWNRVIFEERARAINQILKKWGAVGFRAPMVHRQLEWMQSLEVLYDASCFDYDVFQPFPGGVRSIWPFVAGRFVELPYTLPQDHTLFIILEQKDSTVWRNKTDWLIQHRGVILLITHPDYLDRPERIQIYEEYLDYLAGLPGGWRLLPSELATFWRQRWCGHQIVKGKEGDARL